MDERVISGGSFRGDYRRLKLSRVMEKRGSRRIRRLSAAVIWRGGRLIHLATNRLPHPGIGTVSEHALEHAMSAYHPNLPHGAGLIMISLAYYQHFVDAGCCPERFIRMAQALATASPLLPS